jgi:hypothetical protein
MQQPHSNYGPRDDKPLLDGDTAFLRLNMGVEPDLMQPGEYAFGRNIRLRRGKPTTRRGVLRMDWGTAAVPNTTPVYGSCSFRSPTGISYMLKARENICEACDPTGGVNVIAYPAGITIDSECELVQLFDRVLLLRGEAYANMVWYPPTDWINPFGSVFSFDVPQIVNGTQPIPNAGWAYSFKNRAIVPKGRDQLAASDILNYTRYDPVRALFPINAGDEQSVKGVIKGGLNTLLVFKDYSVCPLTNFTGDLSAVALDPLPIDIGLGARRTLVGYGQDIIFLGPDLALYTLSQALDNKLQGDEKAFSDPVEPLMESIKPALIEKCVSKIWNKSLYLAVPLGITTMGANAILVYDFTTGGWVGVDTSEWFDIQNLLIFPYQGRQRLFFVHENGDLYLMEEGYEDVGPGAAGVHPIATEFVSRGYACSIEANKIFDKGEVALSTWAPDYTIESAANGGNL